MDLMTILDYTVKTLSPVHIGTGVELTQADYVLLPVASDLDSSPSEPDCQSVSDSEQEPRFVRYDTARALIELGLSLDDLSNALERGRSFSLGDHFLGGAAKNDAYWRYSAEIDTFTHGILKSSLLSTTEDAGVFEQMKTHIADRGGRSQFFLAGSSLKGAFRTALIGALLFYLEPRSSVLAEMVKTAACRWSGGDEIEALVLRGNWRRQVKSDLLRMLGIRDAKLVPDERMNPLRIYLLKSLRWNGTGADFLPLKLYHECIDKDVEFTSQLSIASAFLAKTENLVRGLGWNKGILSVRFQDLIIWINELMRKIIAFEQDYFAQVAQTQVDVDDLITFYSDLDDEINSAPSNVCYLSLGKGAGWQKKTIAMFLQHHMDSGEFRDFRRRRRLGNLNVSVFPQSRMLAMQGEEVPKYPLGWVRLTFQEIPPDLVINIPLGYTEPESE